MSSTFSPAFTSTGRPLLPDEDADILDEARKIFGDPYDWFEA